MNINATKIFKIFVFLIVIILLICAGNEEVDARKRNKKDNQGKGKRRGRKHRNRRRDMKVSEPGRPNPSWLPQETDFLKFMKQQRSYAAPTPPNKKQFEIDSWTEAILSVRSENSVFSRTLVKGKFGYHSQTTSVTGKVVHVKDPNMKTHYGCSTGIGNHKEIPKDIPWIALVERGKCYFFNKNRLAKMHNASAVIIYNDRHGKAEVMSTVGNRIVSLMITKEDGHIISSLVRTASPLILTIEAGIRHNTSSIFRSSSIAPVTESIAPSTSAKVAKTVPPWNVNDIFTMTTQEMSISLPPAPVGGVGATPTGGGCNPSVLKVPLLILLALTVVYCHRFIGR